MKKILLSLTILLGLNMVSCSDNGKSDKSEQSEKKEEAPPKTIEEYDEECASLIEKKEYKEAISTLEEFVKYYPEKYSEKEVAEIKEGLLGAQALKEYRLEHGVWGVKHFVDDFGDKTDEAYLNNTADIIGVFSNSATSGSELIVSIIIKPNGMLFFKLFEYTNNPVNPGSYSNFATKVKYSNGESEVLSLENWGDRFGLKKAKAKKIIEEMIAGNEMKFVIQDLDYTTTKYNFELYDFSGFEKAWKELMKIE